MFWVIPTEPEVHGARSAQPTKTRSVDAARARYTTLVEAHFDAVWRSLRGLGVPGARVDDAAQQVFLVLLQKLDRVTVGSERGFLLGTAVGVAANVRRSVARSREVADEGALDREVDRALNPEETLLQREQRALVAAVLDGMDDDIREVFVLCELEGMTAPEVAPMLNVPLGTVASRLRRARQRFQSDAAKAREMHDERA